jgi:hypothetical protein
MEFDLGATIIAGLVAGGVMSTILYMGIAIMPEQMKMNLFLMLGTMMLPTGAMAYVAGAMMHAVASIVFAVIHVALFQAFGLESALIAWGVLFGVGHWLISGMGLGMVPIMHPRMKSGEVQSPGAFALSYPAATAMGFFMLHVLFGVLVGAVYTAMAL